MGGLAFDLEVEPADAFPRGLEAAVGQRRLEHQDVGTLRRQLLDQAARRRAADLLVRGEQAPRPAAASDFQFS